MLRKTVILIGLCWFMFVTAYFGIRQVRSVSQLKQSKALLQQAINADDPVVAAKALLNHARAKPQLLSSPMEALQEGDVQKAWQRADRYEPKQRALWYLLIAWHLQTIGKRIEAKKTLQRLLSSQLPSFAPAPENPLPFILLARVARVDAKAFSALWRKFLEPEWQIDLVLHLLASGNIDEALRIVRSLKRLKDMNDERFDGALSDVAVALAKAGRFNEALEVARMVKLDWYDPTFEIAKAMAERGLLDRARKIGGYRILLHIAEMHAAKGKKSTTKAIFAQAIEIARKRKDERWLHELALAQAETISIEDGIATARQIQSAQLRAETLIALARQLTKKRQAERAKALLLEALKSVQTVNPEFWQTNLLLQLAYSFKSVGDLKQAIAVADKYERLMEREVKGYWSQPMCLEPYFATSRLDEAEKVARCIDEPVNRLHALSLVAKAYALAGQMKRSQTIWNEVLKSAKNLPDEKRHKILEIVVDHQVEACQFQQAIRIVKEFAARNEQSHLFAKIIRSQLEMNLTEEALKTLKQLDDDAEVLSHFVYHFAKKRQFNRALQFARRISHSVEGSEELSKRQQALITVAEGQIRTGQLIEAQKTVAEVLSLPKLFDEKQCQVSALTQIAVAQAVKGKLIDALKTVANLSEPDQSLAVFEIAMQLVEAKKWQEAKQLAEQIANPEMKTDILIAIAQVQAEAGDGQSAAATLKQALKHVDQLPDSFKPIRLESIAILLKAIGQKKQAEEVQRKAKQLMQQLKEPMVGMVSLPACAFVIEVRGLVFAEGILPLDALSALELEFRRPAIELVILARVGKFNEALQQIRQQKSPLVKLWSLSLIAPLASGKLQQQILREAEQIANGLQKREQKVWALMQVAEIYAQLGQKTKAQALFERAFQLAQQISKLWQRERLLTEILKAMAQHGLTKLAADLASQLITEENAHIAELVVTLAQVGDEANFKQLLPLCAETLPNAYAAIGAMAWLYPDRAKDLVNLVLTEMKR